MVNFPLSGRIVPEMNIPQIREVVEGLYRIIYYIKADQIDILAIIHGSQQILWGEIDSEKDLFYRFFETKIKTYGRRSQQKNQKL